jgi:aminobenzoyl-glutamate utilization protein B
VHYTPAEQAFAEKLHATLPQPARALGTQAEIQPYVPRLEYGSTDVGDVSWVVPTAGPQIATWVPGTPAHSWQAVAAGGMSIGFKGMQLAAQAMARTAVALYRDPRLVQEARKEFESRRGPNFEYRPLIGDRSPPLDYRN